MRRMAAALKVAPAEAADRLEALVEERRRLERELAEAKKRLALAGGGEGGASAVEAARSAASASSAACSKASPART